MVSYVKKSSLIPVGWIGTVPAARRAGVDRATLRKWRIAGHVECKPILGSRLMMFNIASVDAYVADLKRREADPEIGVIERFWDMVDKSDGPNACWPWTGYTKDGYGRMKAIGRDNEFTHRVAWKIANGPIPEGVFICHHCDNPPCCNPKHLFEGTNADNMLDMRRKNRSAVGLKNGSFTQPERRPRGERAGSSKLTEDEVRRMRETYYRGGVTQERLSVRYGISQSCVSAAVSRKAKRKTWTHI